MKNARDRIEKWMSIDVNNVPIWMSENLTFKKALNKVDSATKYSKLIGQFGVQFILTTTQCQILLRSINADQEDIKRVKEIGKTHFILR